MMEAKFRQLEYLHQRRLKERKRITSKRRARARCKDHNK
jgi:hypothetical protein